MSGHHETPVRIRFRVAAAVATASTVSPHSSSALCASRAVAPVVSTSSQTTTKAFVRRPPSDRASTPQRAARTPHRTRQVGRPRSRVQPCLVGDPGPEAEHPQRADVVPLPAQTRGGSAGDRPGRVVPAGTDGGRPGGHRRQHDGHARARRRRRQPRPRRWRAARTRARAARASRVPCGRAPRRVPHLRSRRWSRARPSRPVRESAMPGALAARGSPRQAGHSSRPGRSQPTHRDPSNRSTAASTRGSRNRSTRSARTGRCQHGAAAGHNRQGSGCGRAVSRRTGPW